MSKTEQMGVVFAAGYLAGILCGIVSHPADTMVSKINKMKSAGGAGEKMKLIYSGAPEKGVAGQPGYTPAVKGIGFGGLWAGLGPRVVMIGTLTGLQWFAYGAFKTAVGLPAPGGKCQCPGCSHMRVRLLFDWIAPCCFHVAHFVLVCSLVLFLLTETARVVQLSLRLRTPTTQSNEWRGDSRARVLSLACTRPAGGRWPQRACVLHSTHNRYNRHNLNSKSVLTTCGRGRLRSSRHRPAAAL